MSRHPQLLVQALAVAALASAGLAHDDDPKAKNIEPRYEGPGWRAADGGIAGLDFDAQGVALMSWISLPDFEAFGGGNQNTANDCWGYTSPSGREYALIGLEEGTGIVEITNPAAPVIIAVEPGPNSVWHDIKVYQHYAYAVSEAGDGIRIYDLDDIDSGVVDFLGTVTTGGSQATHNVALNEETGYLYRCGGGSGNGIRIYDLANPASPQFVASWSDLYVHDAVIEVMHSGPWVGREIAFLCSGGGGNPGVSILDVTDKGNIFSLIPGPEPWYEYPQGGYSHQAWLSEDQQYLFLNDESDESDFGLTSRMHVIDISDLTDPVEVSTFTNGISAVTHNLYVRGDRVFAANYSSGLRVFDVSNPVSPAEVGFFDATPESDGLNFSNLWSCFPYFESGTVIGSDRQFGLFVWRVTDALVGFDFPEGLPELLDPDGATIQVEIEVGNGTLVEGSETFHYSNGGGPVLHVPMTPLGGGLYEASLPPFEVCGSVTLFYVSAETDDDVVWTDPPGAPATMHSAVVASAQNVIFQDDFESDQGWTVENSPGLSAGAWERGAPLGGGDRGDPASDADGSGQAYLTGPEDGDSDIDGGTTTLFSPTLDATGEGTAFLTYQRWYSNDFGSSPNQDSMLIEVSDNNGITWTLLEEVTENAGAWVKKTFVVSDFVEPTSQLRLRFVASDLGDGSVVEAGVDDVRVVFFDCDDGGEIDADINDDGTVDVDDLVLMILEWGDCPPDPEPCPADLDGNGEVEVDDLVLLILNWS